VADFELTKPRSGPRTLRLGSTHGLMAFETSGAPSSGTRTARSTMRPTAPGFTAPETARVTQIPPPPAVPAQAVPPSGRQRVRSPIDEVSDVLRQLEGHELDDVLGYAQRLVAARTSEPGSDVVTAILAAMGRLYPAYRNTHGVPLPILRGAVVDGTRKLFDEAILEAEARGLIKLVPVSPFAPFVERAAGIHDQRRGLLYYCTTPGARH
jgi:hypothetical protein